MLDVVVFLVSLGVRVIRAMCRRRADLVLENVALRQQVTALKKERPRPPLEDTERAFWVALRGSWPVGIATDSDGCPFHKLELREISELPATRMRGSSSCRTF